jgi:competence protein ComEA
MLEWFNKNRWWLALSLVGLVLLILSIFSLVLNQERDSQIEIISSDEVQETSLIFIHLEGAVEKPGVYEMPEGSRLNDLLIRAGGLAAQADREWIAQNLNLAQKLTDGAKMIIPFQGEIKGLNASISLPKKININQASLSELDTLWGIGEKRGQDIISGRPYQTIEELLTRQIITENIFEKIQNEITAY